jgi:hypothetical protein
VGEEVGEEAALDDYCSPDIGELPDHRLFFYQRLMSLVVQQ